jgi:2-(1,2-epoxy-1,2-dihydrophenyl)acetyl-CoA isomerase
LKWKSVISKIMPATPNGVKQRLPALTPFAMGPMLALVPPSESVPPSDPDRPGADRPDAEELRTETVGGVLRLTLNRPHRKNAISPELRAALLAALEDAALAAEVRCVLITGAGDAFCAGADIGRFTVTTGDQPRGVDPRAAQLAMKRGTQRVIRAIWELDKPVVAAVNGVAAGAGAQLALACDFVLAAESARFIEIFARRGMAVDCGGAYLLPRLVGMSKAKELAFFGDAVSALEAQRIGLVARTVPDSELAAVAHEWSSRLARGATRALGASKQLLNRSFETGLADAFDQEAAAQSVIALSEDYREGVAAFVEKRAPRFTGF